ncbi:carbohydrate ABC transporter membrane protein 2, CUT1 family [Caldanaerobius fijiensis DSM 17918]|uniref:Carbohydrate ABC transporter membrane protein 2, CUT1 family n=1 Tax=Caldanaerobius fijiensis DSM 17918 TaxID=1121256 RepID=A0A1M5DA26_9THEO|nr:carbohydrate ABC transporter permease [Caldanaerobius fijiensis]SHF63715.1 carbohydrate ABC transporter membrane protein 2, CUT1 family [Caldanaerobius fijiensis DSM 17918]
MKLQKTLLYLILFCGGILMIFPFYWMVVLSTHSAQEIFKFPPPIIFGNDFIKNYRMVVETIPLWRNMLNSLFVATSSVLLVLLFCSLAGYAFAMYNFPGKNLLFSLMLVTMMVPGLITIVPWFIMMTKFGWINNYYGLIIPGAANAFGIFWMRQYIAGTLPHDLLDAAKIDGCPEWQIFFRIALPILKPGLAALGIYTFIGSWNNFMGPLLILKDPNVFTLPVALSALQGDPTRGYDYGVLMTGTTLAVAPMLIAFVFLSKYIIQGMTAGAIKQ